MLGFRWTARFLLLVMLAPAFGPLALARGAQPEATHCMRQPMSVQSAQPAMQCHHAMAHAKPPESDSLEASFQATANCCQSHCCCGATTSEWARQPSSLLPFVNLLIEHAQTAQRTARFSIDISGYDSARAPPRS